MAENSDLETCHGCPTLSDNIEDINDMVFQGQKLEKGWLIDGVESGDIPMVNWVMREQQDCVDEVKALACDLHESMRQHYASVPSYLEDLHNVFDLEELFTCLGERNTGGKVILDEIRLEMWGREMFAKFTTYSQSYRRRFGISQGIEPCVSPPVQTSNEESPLECKQRERNRWSISKWFLVKQPQQKKEVKCG